MCIRDRYNVINNTQSDVVLDLSDTSLIDDTIDLVGDIQNINIDAKKEKSSNISSCVSFIQDYNNYETTGGDLQASTISIFKALKAVVDTINSDTGIDSSNISNDLDTTKTQVDSDPDYSWIIPVKEPIIESTQNITISGFFSSGPKQGWNVTFAYLSGGVIDDSKVTNSSGFVEASLTLPTTTQIYKVTATSPASGGLDVLTGEPSKEGESISTILKIDDTTFYASQLSSLFVASLKNESVLDVAKYETLKQEFEEKLGIYDENGEGFNTNPYDITVNPSYANQLSVLEISLSALVSGLSTLFDDNLVDNSEILNAIYDKISTFTSESPITISTLSDKTNFIDPIIENIGSGNEYIDTSEIDTIKTQSGALAEGISIINDYNTYLSTGGDINASVLSMHSVLESIKEVLSTEGTDLTDVSAFETSVNDNVPSISTYNFPYHTPTVDSSSLIPVNISLGFFSGGPKVNWKVTFTYLSGALINGISENLYTDENGSIMNVSFNLLPNTEIYKVTATSTTAGYDALTKVKVLSSTETHSISTILTPTTTTFYASQISNLFVTSIKSETDLDASKYAQLKQEFEEKLGIYEAGGDGMNTNPYDISVSPAFANKLSVLNVSLSSLISGLDTAFDDTTTPNVVDKSEILLSLIHI